MSLCGAVLQILVLGVGVNRGHETVLDAERIFEHLDHGHEAVSCARADRRDFVVSRGRSLSR